MIGLCKSSCKNLQLYNYYTKLQLSKSQNLYNTLINHTLLIQGIQSSTTRLLSIFNEYASIKTHSDVLINDMNQYSWSFTSASLPDTFSSYSKILKQLETQGRKYNHAVLEMKNELDWFKCESLFEKELDAFVENQINCLSLFIDQFDDF